MNLDNIKVDLIKRYGSSWYVRICLAQNKEKW
jgi:hypothetical protein